MPNFKGDDAKKPAECKAKSSYGRECPNMKEVGGGFDGEQYRCEVCGAHYYLDYDEMR